MAGASDKVVYLKKEDGKSFKAYVIDYLVNSKNGKKYVIVAANSRGSNAKVYEIDGEQAIILTREEIGQFTNYFNNLEFEKVTDMYEDGLMFDLVKRESKISKETAQNSLLYIFDQGVLRSYRTEAVLGTDGETTFSNMQNIQTWKDINLEEAREIFEQDKALHSDTAIFIEDKMTNLIFTNGVMKTKPHVQKTSQTPLTPEISKSAELFNARKNVFYYVLDQDVLRCYQANVKINENGRPIFDEIHHIETWKNVDPNEAEIMIANQNHQEEVYFIPNKMRDLIFQEGKIEAKQFSVIKPKKVEKAIDSIIFYVYDGKTVKKYQGTIHNKKGTNMELSDYRLLTTITGAANLERTRFLEGEEVEENAYFVEASDFKEKDGTAEIVKAVRKIKSEPVRDPKPLGEEKVIVMNGDIDVYNGSVHYTVLGCICTVKSKNPFTLVAENNGIKTITFEHPGAQSISEVCQAYQDLYPNIPVLLLNGLEIIDGKEHVLEEKDYKTFTSNISKEKSLLESGRRVLSEQEMIENRRKDLEDLQRAQKKRANFNTYFQSPILEKYRKEHPEDTPFIHYLQTLVAAGITEEHMKATGLYSQIEEKMGMKSSISSTDLSSVNQQSGLSPVSTLSASFRKHFPIVKGVNDDILRKIVKMEKFDHTPEQIIEELCLPPAMVEQFREDIPTLKSSKPEAKIGKAM